MPPTLSRRCLRVEVSAVEMVLASRNKKKISELQTILSANIPNLRLLSLDDIGYEGDIEENGETYAENALIKARTAMLASGGKYPAVADDSGLSVDALNGAPGVYSARYAGAHGDDAANNALLIKNMADVPDAERTARFVCTIACVFPSGHEILVRGETEGVILHAPRGEGGFGYDPYFYNSEFGKSFAELTPAEKNSVSHRGRAIASFAEALSAYMNLQEN